MLYSNTLGAFGILISDAIDGALDELSPSAAALLLTLHYQPNITISRLAEVAGIAQSTAVRVLDGLARRGWLKRRPRVGRTTPLLLTDVGKQRALSVQQARLDAMDRLLATLPEQELNRFVRSLDRILAAATTSREFARTTCRLCDHAACDGAFCPIGTRATELEQTIPGSSQ
jgi:DNA-binding MarR family transcriptional regulator